MSLSRAEKLPKKRENYQQYEAAPCSVAEKLIEEQTFLLEWRGRRKTTEN